jgi:hypothetical protein
MTNYVIFEEVSLSLSKPHKMKAYKATENIPLFFRVEHATKNPVKCSMEIRELKINFTIKKEDYDILINEGVFSRKSQDSALAQFLILKNISIIE